MTLDDAREVARQHGCEIVTASYLDALLRQARRDYAELNRLRRQVRKPGLLGRLFGVCW